MAISNLFRLDAVILPSNDIQSITRQDWTDGVNTIFERGAGGIRPLFTGVSRQEPEIRFSTPQIDKILDDITPGAPLAISSALTTYFKKMGQTGHVARATTSHQSAAVNYGLAYIDRINLEAEGNSTVDVVICCGFDGTNDPIVFTGSVALDATDLASADHFAVGPVSINGSAVAGIQRVTIESGVTIVKEFGEGDVWPTFVGLETTEPMIRITTKEVAPFVTAGVDGLALDGSNGVVVYARRLTQSQAGGVARVANATASHIKFTALNGKYHCSASGQGSSSIDNEILVALRTTADGTAEITVDNASAIT